MQPCRVCGCIKPLSDFTFRKDSGKPRTDCNQCRSTSGCAARYGVTVGEIDSLRIKQDNRCAICQKHIDEIQHESFKHNPLVIDHDHLTGLVRGLLCSRCNFILGNADDSISILLKAVEYLSNWAK